MQPDPIPADPDLVELDRVIVELRRRGAAGEVLDPETIARSLAGHRAAHVARVLVQGCGVRPGEALHVATMTRTR